MLNYTIRLKIIYLISDGQTEGNKKPKYVEASPRLKEFLMYVRI